MPASITGIIFNDSNHNGLYDANEVGIPNVFVVLYDGANCQVAQTGTEGSFSFTVDAAGSYTLYETVAEPGSTCPPDSFTQPEGFTMSNGPRKISVNISAAQINSNATISGQNFAHDTNNATLECNTDFIQFVGNPTNWYDIDVVTGQAIFNGLLNPADYVNAIGFNVLDNYIYGYDLTTNNIVRVDTKRNLMSLGMPTGLPVNGYNTGCIDSKGFFYIMLNGATRFYTIDLRPNSATFMKLVDPRNSYAEQTSAYGTALSSAADVSDWDIDDNGFLYGIYGRTGVMYRINTANGNVVALTTSGPVPGGSFGAIAIDKKNNIYAIANQTGDIYRYTVSGMVATGVYFSSTFPSTNNDATMCRLAEVDLDFGDAPDLGPGNGPGNYNTLLANNGPHHQIRNSLYLGSQATAEEDAYQNSDASGDDLVLAIPDDGLAVPLSPLYIDALSYSLDVSVTNQSGSTAYLYGWIDFNQNGLFEVNESALVAGIESLPTLQNVKLNFSLPSDLVLSPGDTFVRLRLTTLALESSPDSAGQDSASLGPAFDGEVEDYILNIAEVADLSIMKSGDANPATAGDLLTYSLEITNLGPCDAQDVIVEDEVPSEILNPEFSTDGINWLRWQGPCELGTLLKGKTAVIYIRGSISQGASEALINRASVSSSTYDPDLSNNIADVTTELVPKKLSREDALKQIISSIALEEVAISHILNAEGEKIQYIIGGRPDSGSATFEEVINANAKVRDVLQSTVQYQSLLNRKFRAALKAYDTSK